MNTAITVSHLGREPELLGQLVVVIGGSAGIGFETARRARAQGAKVILTARNPERLKHAATEIDAMSTAAFDATDTDALESFFRDLPVIDHVMVTAGRPYYGRLADMDFAKIRDLIGAHLLQALYVARNATSKVRPGGTLIFMGGTGGRRPAIGMSIASAVTAALPALTANLALEIAPVRVNLIAAGFVDTPLSAELLGNQLEKRRNQLRTTLPIGRVVGPADVAALAVHIMTNTALTGATYDIDGGQQFVAAYLKKPIRAVSTAVIKTRLRIPGVSGSERRHACPRSTCTRQPPRRPSSTSPGSPTSGPGARSSLATAPTGTSRCMTGAPRRPTSGNGAATEARAS